MSTSTNTNKSSSNNHVSYDSTFNNNIEQDEIELCDHAELLSMYNTALKRSRRWLYFSHFFAHFSQNYWHFSIIIFLSKIFVNDSMFYISTFGLSLSSGTVILTPIFGKWLDQNKGSKRNQLRVIWHVLLGKHLTVVLLALLCSWSLLFALAAFPLSPEDDHDDDLSPSPKQPNILSTASIIALVLIHILGTLAQVLYQTFNIIIERDLVVMLSQHSDDAELCQSQWLSETNAIMRVIGLIAPAVTSFLILDDKLQYTCIIIVTTAFVALIIENLGVKNIFKEISVFEQQQQQKEEKEIQSTDLNLSVDRSNDNTFETCVENGTVQQEYIRENNQIIEEGKRWAFALYVEQPTAFAGLSLSLLYANSITFGNGILSAYLLSQGLKARTIGMFRGVSDGVGMLGTIVYTLLLPRYGLEVTGVLGLASQATSLAIATIFLSHSDGNKTFLYLSIFSICASRLGLWIADISVVQLQQQEIPEQIRCLIGGVQEALNSILWMIPFVLGMILVHPEDFIYICISGTISVGIAFSFFFFGVYLPRRSTRRSFPEMIQKSDQSIL